MATRSGLLSDIQLRQWARAGKPLARSDGNGLTFTLSVAGAAVWVLRYRFGSRRHELTLGCYPQLGLADARAAATVKRAEILQGINPGVEKRRARVVAAKDWTLRQLVQDYREKKLVSLARSTQRSYGRHLRLIERSLGSMTVREAEAGDIVTLIEDSKLTWGESHMMLVTAKCLFTHACGKRLIDANPCMGIVLSALLGPRPPIRKRLMLTRQEIHLLLNAQMRRANQLAIRVLLACGVRSSELYTAKWQDVHLDEARWHVPASKTGPAIDIPLAPVVVRWLRELRDFSGSSAYVLPARKQARVRRQRGDTHLSKDTIRESIDYWIAQYGPEIRRFTPHDLRSTMKSHMRALGVPRDISEMCLNHKLPGVEGIYDQYTYYAERKAALEAWAGFLQRCEVQGPGQEDRADASRSECVALEPEMFAGVDALLGTTEAAARLKLSAPCVARLCDAGKLGEVIRTQGGRRRIRASAVAAYLADRQPPPLTAPLRSTPCVHPGMLA
jgi:excisionase family DNA binding protein